MAEKTKKSKPKNPKCKFCREEISQGAKVCPKCGKYQNFWHFNVNIVTVIVSLIISAFLLWIAYKDLANSIAQKISAESAAKEATAAKDIAIASNDSASLAIRNVKDVLIKIDTIKSTSSNLIQTLEKMKSEIETDRRNYLENRNRTERIEKLIEKSKNGSKSNYLELVNFCNTDSKISEAEREFLDESFWAIRNIWKEKVHEQNFLRLVDSNKKIRKWTLEYLFFWGWGNTGNQKECINEIAINKYEYFVYELYKLAISTNDMFLAIEAIKSICSITDFAPYKKRRNVAKFDISNEIISDIPRFVELKRWWETEGKVNSNYLCPFPEIVDLNRNPFQTLNYHYKDRSTELERISKLKPIIEKYPMLSGTNTEYAYLILDHEDLNTEVKQKVNLALTYSDTEPLPYLILSYLEFKQNQSEKATWYIDEAIKNTSLEQTIFCFVAHQKLNLLTNLPYMQKLIMGFEN